VQSFKIFLCAILGRPYSVSSIAELERLTELADFYCALPAFSTSLNTALWKSPKLTSQVPANPLKFLPIAAKLRNALLFKESLIQAIGPWKSPRYLQLTDSNLKQAAIRAFGALSTSIVKVQCQLLAATQGLPTNYGSHEWGKRINAYIEGNLSLCYSNSDGVLNLPHFIRRMHNCVCGENNTTLVHLLFPILKNNLILDRTGAIAGEGNYKDFFLCIEIDDADLPWDQTQLDW
jgi:hypothetical protein